MCKGCGHKLDVPDPGPDDEPAPAGTHPLEFHPPPATEPPDEPLIAVDTSSKVDFDVVPPSNPPLVKPAEPPVPHPPPAERRAFGIAVDVLVGLLLAAGGAFLGEIVTQKGTAEVFGAATKQVPPVDLPVWIGCVLFPVLVYLLVANRGKSVGGRLRRRG
jgi:hypothetical protein